MKRGFILLTVLTLAAMLLAGCAPYEAPSLTPEETTPSPTTQPPIPGPSTGTIKVLVTDAPGEISRIDVTVSEVEVHKAGGDGESGKWITLDIANKGQPFNLLALQDGLTLLLAEGEVESGTYTQLRMTVFNVIVDYDDVTDKEATVPSDKLKFVRPFTLEVGGEITLIVDFDAAKSVVFTGATKDDEVKVIFKPVVKLLIKSTLLIEYEEHPSAPTASFAPTSGPVGTSIDVTGTGWVADDTITSVEVGTVAVTPTLTVNVDGNLSGTITVPDVLVPATYSIVIEGENSGEQTFPDAFEVTTVTPTATFVPTSGPVETVITVTGTGWVADDTITSVEVGTVAVTPTLTVNVDGNLSGTITVPDVLVPATYSIVIEGENSDEQTFADAFEVTTQ